MAVSDGCSASPSAEVGAMITARSAVYAGLRWAKENPHEHPSNAVHAVIAEVLATLRTVAQSVGGASHAQVVIADMLLATLLVTIATPAGAAVFAIGDGVLGHGDDVRVERAPEHSAIYLAAALDPRGLAPSARLFFSLSPAQVTHIVLGTDGAYGLFSRKQTPADLLTESLRARPASLRWQLESMVRDAAQTSDDDVTVAMLVRHG
jgi:hypothetical protein